MYKIGANVYGTDGPLGRLLKVAIDPHTRRVTDLVVGADKLLNTARVIPVEVVDERDGDEIHLTVSSQNAEDYPAYREAEFASSASATADEMGYQSDETVQWALRYGEALAGIKHIQPRIKKRVPKGVDSDRPRIGRGTRVRNAYETIGYIDHVLVDEKSGEITHLVVRRGLLPFRAVVPMSMVKEVDDDTIYVPATHKQLQSLGKFTPRTDRDILSEVEDRLQAVTDFDLSQIKVSLIDGLVRLTGPVADVLGKREAQEIAEDVEGVLEVENKAVTDTEVESRVTAALLAHDRTALAQIDIRSENGIVTLTGSVADEETKAAAESIAAEQSGVREVNSRLTVE